MVDQLNVKVIKIKDKYALDYDNDTMYNALTYARQQIAINAYSKEKGSPSSNDTNNVFTLCSYVMDTNFDGVVNKSDIVVKQYMKNYPYTVADLSDNIDSIIFDSPTGMTYITMDDTYPSQGYTMQIEYSRGAINPADADETISYLEELYTVYHLFNILEINKLQRGMLNKSINGVDITFDKTAVDDFKKQLKVWIQNEILKIKPFTPCGANGFGSTSPLAKSIQINKGY